MDESTTQKLMNILKQSDSFDGFLEHSAEKQISISLPEYFDYLFEEKAVKKSKVIRQSLLDPYYAYQIFRGEKKASRNKLLQIAFAFPLTIKETQLLLYLGGVQKLYIKNKFDSIILFSLDNGLPIDQVTALLIEQQKEPFI